MTKKELEMIDCSRELLKRTNIPYISYELKSLILGERGRDDDIYRVVSLISGDTKLLSGYAILDVPCTDMYCIGNIENEKYFLVFLNGFSGDGDNHAALGYLNAAGLPRKARTIPEAVQKNCWRYSRQ